MSRKKSYMFMIGKKSFCNSFRHKTKLVHMQRFTKNSFEDKFIDVGCGKVYLCVDCAKKIVQSRTVRLISLAEVFHSRNPNFQIAHFVFTVPDDHEYSIKDTVFEYKKLLHLVRDLIISKFGDVGIMLTLHNWSSKDPEKPNLHVHAIIFGIDSDGNYINFYSDVKLFRDKWKKSLCYYPEYNPEKNVNVNLNYKTKMNEIAHVIKYAYRSPILDFIKLHGVEKELTYEYLERVEKLRGIQHIRYYGWLANNRKKKSLKFFNIIEQKILNEDLENWQFVESVMMMMINRSENWFKIEGIDYKYSISEELDEESFIFRKIYIQKE